MLRLEISKTSNLVREEFRAWLEKNPPPAPTEDTSLETFIARGRDWQRRLAGDNWVALHWPKEFGGRSLSLVEEAVVQEELVRAGAPQLLGLFGLTMVGPVLIEHGSEDQQRRYLPGILDAGEIWCQGFSEPGAGSDLAAIKTKAVKTEGGFLVSGQKIWTSFAQIADYCFLLCRTSESGRKHEGLSYLLLDMKAKGVTTRPLKQVSGDEEFNEVFLDEVYVPLGNLVGEEGEGWKIAISTLMHERVILTFARQLQSEVAIRRMVERYKDSESVFLKVRLAEEVVKSAAVRALAYSHLLLYSAGRQPGPEGSLDKLIWSETFQDVSRLALDFLGPRAVGGESDSLSGPDVHQYLYSRGRTIAAGTSEIQRNIIADRLLRLPK